MYHPTSVITSKYLSKRSYNDEGFLHEPDAEEQELAKKLFGQKAELFGQEESESEIVEESIPNDFFVIDKKRRKIIDEPKIINKERTKNLLKEVAWNDENEEIFNLLREKRMGKLKNGKEENEVTEKELENRLRDQFKKLHPEQSWAQLPSETNADKNKESRRKGRQKKNDDYTDEEEETQLDDHMLLKNTSSLTNEKSKILLPDILDTIRVKNANQQSVSKCVIESVQFHPNAQILLTAGFDKTLRLFRIDGNENPKVQSIHFPDLPIHTAKFTSDGKEVICSGRRKFFYTYDIEGRNVQKILGIQGRSEKSFEKFFLSPDDKYISFIGKDGYIVILSKHSKQWVANLKMNSAVRSLTFSADGITVYSSGEEGDIYTWDIRTFKCIGKWSDKGSLKGTSLALAPNSNWLASGNNSGVVNIYDIHRRDEMTELKPMKELMNLTTSIHHLQFNHDSQLLGICSRARSHAFRLVHIPSMRVYSNWPTMRTPLHFASAFDFSPRSGYLAIGNDKGKALLYRLNHYPTA